MAVLISEIGRSLEQWQMGVKDSVMVPEVQPRESFSVVRSWLATETAEARADPETDGADHHSPCTFGHLGDLDQAAMGIRASTCLPCRGRIDS